MASVLTLYPVPAHWAEEVGIEAEGLIDLPEDPTDVPDLWDGHPAHHHFPEGATDTLATKDASGGSGAQRKPLWCSRRESHD